MRKSTNDFLCGLCFLAIGIAFAAQMGGLEGKSLLFPRALIAVVLLGGLWFTGKGLWLRRLERNPHPHGEAVAWKKVGVIALASVLYALGIAWLGFFSATLLFMALSALLLGERDRGRKRLLLVSVAYSLVFSALVWLCFVKLLNVPTPSGLLF